MQESISLRTVTFATATTGDMSGNLTSDTIKVPYRDTGLAIQCYWTGSPEGLLDLQYSLDDTNWTTHGGSTVKVQGGADNFIYEFLGTAVPYYRLRWRYSPASTGTLNARAYTKG